MLLTMGQPAIHTVLLDMAVLGDTSILQTTPAQLTPPPACRMSAPMDVQRTASASLVPRITPFVPATEARITRRVVAAVTQFLTLAQLILADAQLTLTRIVAVHTGLRGPAATLMLVAPALVTALLVILDQPVMGMEPLVIPDQTLAMELSAILDLTATPTQTTIMVQYVRFITLHTPHIVLARFTGTHHVIVKLVFQGISALFNPQETLFLKLPAGAYPSLQLLLR